MKMEQTIWEIPLPEVTLQDLFHAAGIQESKRAPRPNAVELLEKALIEVRTLVKPKLIWGEVKLVEVTEHEVLLADGKTLTSPLLAKIARTADKLVFLVMTIGEAVDVKVDYYQKLGRMIEAYYLDSAGSACIAKSATAAMEKIAENYKAQGMSMTFPMGPGHSYWQGLEDMQTIFYFLEPGQIGLSLTKSNLMLPRKSIAMVAGVGQKLPDLQGKTHCDFCNLQNTCKMRNFGQQC